MSKPSTSMEPAGCAPWLTASSQLMRAAMSGLLAAGAAGCPSNGSSNGTSKTNGSPDKSTLSDQELKALCSDMVDAAKKSVDLDSACADMVSAAKQNVDLSSACADMVSAAKSNVDLSTACFDMVTAAQQSAQASASKAFTDQTKSITDKCEPLIGTVEEKTTSSEQKQYTFAELTKMCDDRGGYIEISGHCAGTNTCRGFTYGDWGSGATLTEHTCAGVNGCNGLYCMVLPPDSGKSGKEIYETKSWGDPGPGACVNCHATWNDDETVFDGTVFKVYQFADGTRTTDNWLTTRSEAEQQRLVAFGVHSVRPDGVAYRTMAIYKDLLSRAEIERVVSYVRTLTPMLETIKTADP